MLWCIRQFDELSVESLYQLMAIRQEVFIVEQNCPYLDADGKDLDCMHIMGYNEIGMVATARIVPPNISYAEVSIGRVATSMAVRRQGVGIELMETCLIAINNKYGNVPIRISAQTYLLKFYQSFGFEPTGKEYLEDGIPHTELLKPASA